MLGRLQRGLQARERAGQPVRVGLVGAGQMGLGLAAVLGRMPGMRLAAVADLAPERAAAVLEECGMTFLFAPLFHPAMRHVGPVRRELGLGTIMNLIGPLANPAGVTRQVIGAGDPARAPLIAGTLALLGAEHALVVHAPRGLDEIAPPGLGPTDVWEVRGNGVKRWTLNSERFALADGDAADLAGGSPNDNARTVEAILDGSDRGVRRSAVVLNAAAALVVGAVARDWEDGVRRAGEAVDSGAARQVLERLRRASRPSTSG